MDGFKLNKRLLYFSKFCEENSSTIKNLTRISGTLHEDLWKCIIYLVLIFLGWEMYWTKVCTENQNTHLCSILLFFIQNIIPFSSMLHHMNITCILYSWFRASWLYINKIQQDATVCRYWFTASLLYMFRASIAPIVRSTKNCNCNLWYRS